MAVINNPERSYWVIVALGLIKDKRAVAPLINILDNESLINTPHLPYYDIRKSAIEALVRIGDPESIEPL